MAMDINRILERLQDLSSQTDHQGRQFNDHLRKIEGDLMDLANMLRGKPELRPKKDASVQRSPSVRDAQEVVEVREVHEVVPAPAPQPQPVEEIIYLSPPPLRPESPVSFISSVSFLSSHYSDISLFRRPSSPPSSPLTDITPVSSPPSSEISESTIPSSPTSSTATTATARPRVDFNVLRDMLSTLQQQHAGLLEGQRETKALLRDLHDRPQPEIPVPPPPRDETEDAAARQGVIELLHRILNALGIISDLQDREVALPAPSAPPTPPAPPFQPPSEESSDELGDRVLEKKWDQVKRSPIVTPQPVRPGSRVPLEEWESFAESEGEVPVPPTDITIRTPITVVEVPPRTSRARSVSPISTVERTPTEGSPEDVFSATGRPIFEQGMRDRYARPGSPRPDHEYRDVPRDIEGSESSVPRSLPDRPRRDAVDPALDFLKLVRDHRRGRRGGDGTFVPATPKTPLRVTPTL